MRARAIGALRAACLAAAMGCGPAAIGATPAAPSAEAPAQPPAAAEPVMLELYVNDVKRNDILVLVDTSSEVAMEDAAAAGTWVLARDFEALGIAVGAAPRADLGGETYLHLAASAQLAVDLDLDMLRLSLRFAPELLGTQLVDLATVADLAVAPALPAHGWVDYAFDVRADRAQWRASADLALNLAAAGWTVRSEFVAVAAPEGAGSDRLRSFAERDWPQAMVRVSLGDLPPSRLAFGELGPLRGLRVARRFDLRPGFGATPTFSYDGSVDTPATAEIYLDDALLRTVPIAPGRFDLRNLAYYAGLRDVRIVLSDATGDRREVLVPHYFSESPLKRGLHEFEYTLASAQGDSAAPRGPALTAWHRYGLADRWTLGAGLEATREARVWSADIAAVLGRAGTLQGQYARLGGGAAGEPAAALNLRYAFVAGAFSFSLGEWRMDPGFRRRDPLSAPATAAPLTGLTSTSLAFALPGRQSLSLSASRERREGAADATRFALRYAARPTGRISLGARFARSRVAGRNEDEAMLSVQVDFGRGWSGGLELERMAGRDRRALAVERGSPQAGGWGLRARVEEGAGGARVEALAQRDLATGEFGALLRQRRGDPAGAMLGLQYAGALVAAGGRLRAARPVREGFALVDTGGLADVRVYRNNTLAGRTGPDGRLLLTGLGAYTRQQIRLDDRDIPIEVALDAIVVDAVPRSRIGVDLRFPSKRIVAAGGRLAYPAADGALPVGSAVLALIVDGQPVRRATAPDGGFYLDGLGPGEFTLEARNATLSCRATIRIDPAAPAFTDLGEVPCAPAQ